ncbi:MAG: helix-turn-helix domain-containing protein [Bacteroidales bacterium]|nr:helix-turn-helix domain-containing protein [Bacteroidales bacterium]
MMQERILLLMKSFGMNPTEFADEIGVQRSSISHILSGRNNPSLDLVTKILNRFPEIDSNWLVLGKGSLVVKSEEKSEKIENNETSKPSNNLFEQDSNDLFSDNQSNNSSKGDKNTIDELQRKIEILEKRSAEKETQSTILENNVINRDIDVAREKVEVKNREDERVDIIQKADSSLNSNSNKHIKKVIIFYSDNSYEELIKM